MKLILSQKDFDVAIRAHLSTLMTLSDQAKMEFQFKEAQGDQGVTVEIQIEYMGVTSLPGIVAPKTAAPAPTPVGPSPAPGAAASAPEVPKKIDLRTAEGRKLKAEMEKSGGTAQAEKPVPTNIFNNAPKPAATEPEKEEIPTPEEIAAAQLAQEAADRAAEAAEIEAEAANSPDPQDEVEQEQVPAPVAPAAEEGAPAPKRKSLFG